MNKRFAVLVLVALLAGLWIPPALAQVTGTVKGVCRDAQGNPIVGATVEWYNSANGRKYALKTNKKGEYFSLGIEPGKYRVTLSHEGKQLDQVNNFPVQAEESTLDFDLKQAQIEAAKQQGMTPEQMKQIQEQQEKAAKETDIVKALNERLAAADTASKAGDFDTAITVLSEATQMDASRDVLWAKLADAYRNSAVKQTDAAEKKKRLEAALADYQKALETRQQGMQANPRPDDAKQVAAYLNNMGDAASKANRIDDAVKAYAQAAQTDPAGAAGYYFNIGAVLTNANRVDEAIAAFDKAIAADPAKADAYYWKGVNLVSKATTDPKTGKVMPAAGTEEALNKYLELQPTGTYAEGAKGMLQYIGSTIETSFGKKKGTKK